MTTGSHRSRRSWPHLAGPFEALGYRFSIGAVDADWASHLRSLWSACGDSGPKGVVYGIDSPSDATPSDVPSVYTLYRDEDVITKDDRPSIVLRDLVRHVNRAVVEAASPEILVMHAGGASRVGSGLLLPASMEAGKSTLVAGLLRAGWGYLSDEAVGVDPEGWDLVPYPKPVSIDPGSWEVLADLEPVLPAKLAALNGEQWQLAPKAPSKVVNLRAVVSPSFQADATTRLDPLSPPESLKLLADSCFSLARRPQWSLDGLARLVATRPCYRLTLGSIEPACGILERLIEGATAKPPPRY